MSDPSHMTKAKLKEELERHNIPLPKSNARKQSYIDLYTQHFLQGQTDHDAITEFSDLEDQSQTESEESGPETVLNKKTPTLTEKGSGDFEVISKVPEVSVMSIHDLTDAELAQELREKGLEPGPIAATTRKVYEKKLFKLRQEEGNTTEKLIEPLKYEEVPDDEERSPPPKPRTPVKRTPPRAPKPETDQRPEPTYTSGATKVTHRTPIRPEPKPMPAAATKPVPKTKTAPGPEKSSGGVPLWAKLLVLACVVFFVYLVYINMEPSGSKIPKVTTGSKN